MINDTARQRWLEWKRRTDPLHYLDPKSRAQAWYDAGLQMVREGLISAETYWGTINCDGVNAKGEVCGVTTTSGLAWKIPGRAGDSPILGAGLYVDGEVGAAGSTGRGEANLYNLSSFLIVEEMRRGAHPKDAAMTALKRVAKNTIEKRLLNSKGQPNFGLSFYCLNAKGEYAGVAMYESSYAVCTENGPQTLQTDALVPRPRHRRVGPARSRTPRTVGHGVRLKGRHGEDDMPRKLNRREFVQTTTAAGVVAATAKPLCSAQAPTMMTPKSVKPVVVAASNGNRSKNEKGQTCVAKAFEMITGGADVLDALVAGVAIVELDPEDSSVGYGGIPNANGVVQLDSCCMHGPKKRAGGVAALEGVRTPAKVAQLVADQTDHHLLVGKGAQDFARLMGFTIEDDLNTEKSRNVVARVEAQDRSAALPADERARRSFAPCRDGNDCRGLDRGRALLRHDQLRRHQREG